MAIVYQTCNRGEATVLVYITPNREEADLWVYSPPLVGQAHGDGLWYITKNRHQARQLCYFCARGMSQVTVFFVESLALAGWRRPHRLRGYFQDQNAR